MVALLGLSIGYDISLSLDMAELAENSVHPHTRQGIYEQFKVSVRGELSKVIVWIWGALGLGVLHRTCYYVFRPA